MCGRYALQQVGLEVAQALDAPLVGNLANPLLATRTNISPGETILAARVVEGERVLAATHWGITRHVEGKRRQLINARSEGVLRERSMWRPMLVHMRLAIPASGFFEWTGPKGARTANWISTSELMVFAGIGTPDTMSRLAVSGVILTTPASADVEPVHDRMPAILEPDALDVWLDAALPPEDAMEVIRPVDGLTVQPVEGPPFDQTALGLV
jgi:putative SOS response-associated peptidase YedK